MTSVAVLFSSACSRARVASAAGVVLAACLNATVARAADVQDAQEAANQHTRAEINAKRAAVQKAYDDKVKDCRARFVVTGCLEDAHTWRIEALRPLQEQEIELNARERQQRAAAQRERVQAKEQEASKDAHNPAPTSVKTSPRPASSTALPAARSPRANPQEHQQQEQRQQAAAERKAAERRQAAASREAKQRELQQRAKDNADKRAKKPTDPKKPAPAHLPTPSASDIQSLPGR